MRKSTTRHGYTLVETIVAVLVFSVGALGMTSTAALIGRELSVDGVRERAGRTAVTRIERLRAGCSTASGGDELVAGVRSQWSVAVDASGRVTLEESVSYAGWNAPRADTYRSSIQCP